MLLLHGSKLLFEDMQQHPDGVEAQIQMILIELEGPRVHLHRVAGQVGKVLDRELLGLKS